MSLLPQTEMFGALPDLSATKNRKDSIPPSSAPSIKTHGKKKMAEPRKDSRTKASEVVAVSSSKHVKEESELHKCLGDDCNDEKLLKSYSCAWQKDGLLIQGRIYITITFVCFYSNLFGSKVIIDFADITTVAKQNTAFIFPNAIMIASRDKKFVFTSFMTRRKAYRTLQCVWRNVKKENPLGFLDMQRALASMSDDSKLSASEEHEQTEEEIQADSSDGASIPTEDSMPLHQPVNSYEENASAQLCSTEALFGDSESSNDCTTHPFQPQEDFSGSSMEGGNKYEFQPSPSLIVLPSKERIVDDEVEKDSAVVRRRPFRGEDVMVTEHSSMEEEDKEEERRSREQTDGANNDGNSFANSVWRRMYHQCVRKFVNFSADTSHPLSPSNLINIVIVILIIILIISSLSLLCKLSCVDPKLQPWMSWQPWCSKCASHIKPSEATIPHFPTSSISKNFVSADVHTTTSKTGVNKPSHNIQQPSPHAA